mgnify:CR=1 FL=1
MPRLSDSMEEGTILKWLVSEGDDVKRGQPIAEIETDKANMTYEADADGTVSELVASEGDTLPVGDVIARLNGAGGKSEPKADESKQEEEPEQEEEPPPDDRRGLEDVDPDRLGQFGRSALRLVSALDTSEEQPEHGQPVGDVPRARWLGGAAR